MCTAARLDSMQVVDRWSVHKVILREVAKVALDEHLTLHGHVGEGASLTLTSIARAVWFADLGLARVLMARFLIARTHIQIQDRSVSIRYPVSFASLVELDRHSTFAQRVAAAEAEEPVGTKKARSKPFYVCAIERMAKLWSPFDKRLVLSGIRRKQLDGFVSIVTSPSGKVATLRDSWAPTFSAKPFDSELASRVLAQYATTWDFSGVSPPCLEYFEAALLNVRPSAPGPDGLPYSAWTAAGRSGAVTLHLVTQHMLSGFTMPIRSNASLMVFVPKGEELDERVVTREPVDTRPLSLKNSDNKLACTVLNRKLRQPLSVHACSLQRGFVPGRQLVANVVDLDTHARVHGMQSDVSDHSVLSLFGFAAAFPSLGHSWIFACLLAFGVPEGAADLIGSIYHFNIALAAVGGAFTPLLFIFSGVLQGCPLSGFLFAMGIDPFLAWMYIVLGLPGLATIRVCAGDLGASLRRLSALLVLFPIFRTIRIVTGLDLKPRKCVLIPTGQSCSILPIAFVRSWLVQHIPQWSRFKVVSSARYLGFFLGPGSNCHQWIVPVSKWLSRAQNAADAHSAASVTASRYNLRAVPVLGYIAQLLPPPPDFEILEKKLIHRMLHLPSNSLGFHPLFRLAEAGGPRIRSVSAYAHACRLRTAVVTVTHWPGLLDLLRRTALEFLPLAGALSGLPPGDSLDAPPGWAPFGALWWPECWSSKPFCWY